MPATLKSRFNDSRGHRNGSGEARRFQAVAGTSQKPFQPFPGPAKRLRRSEKILRGSRQLSKAASTPRNVSAEAKRFPAVAGTSQKPPQRPPAPPKRLGRSDEGFRGCRDLSKAVSTPPRGRRNDFREARRFCAVAGNSQKQPLRPAGAAETTPEKRGGFPRLPATLKSRLIPRGSVEECSPARPPASSPPG